MINMAPYDEHNIWVKYKLILNVCDINFESDILEYRVNANVKFQSSEEMFDWLTEQILDSLRFDFLGFNIKVKFLDYDIS